MSLIRKKSVRKAISTVTGLTMVVWMCGIGMLAPMMGVVVADDRPSVTVDGVTVYDGDLISSNATNPDGTPTYESLDIYISKVVSDTETYKRLVLNPSVFNSYGHLVWGDVAEVSPTVMAGFTTSDLARQDGTDEVYSLVADDDTGTKHWVNLTATQFVDEAGEDADKIYTINATDTGSYTTGGAYTDVTNFIARTAPAVATGDLTAALASDTPAATTLPDGSAYNEVTKLNLTAAGGDVNVTGFRVTRGGYSLDADFTGIMIFNSGERRHGNVVNLSSNEALITFASDPIVVPAGQTVPVSIQVNIDAAQTTNGTFNFRVSSSDDIITEGTVTASGSFPITGNTFSVIDGANTLGAVDVDAVTILATARNVDLGSVAYQIGKFRIYETASKEDIQINSIRLYNNGNTTDADLENLKLKNDVTGDTLATADSTTDKYVTFTLDTPLVITKGQNKTLVITADVVGGSTRTAQFILQNDYDISATGVSTGGGLLATHATNLAGDASAGFPVGEATDYNTITVTQGSLSITKDISSPSGNLSQGQANAVLGYWKLEAVGEDIQIQKADFEIGGNTTDADFSGTVSLVVSDDDTTLYSTSTLGTLFDTVVNGTDQKTLSNYYTITAGTSVLVKIVANVASAATNNETVIGQLGDIYYKRMSTNNYTTVSNDALISANTMTISTAALIVAKNASFGDQDVVGGGAGTKIGSYIFQSGSAEGVNVSSVNVDMSAVDGMTNMKLKKVVGDTETQIGSTVSTPSTDNNANSFSVGGSLNIPASDSVVVNVYVDMSSDAVTVNTDIDAGDVTASGASSGTTLSGNVPTAQVVGQAITLRTSGTLLIETDSSTPVEAVIHSSEADRELLRVKFTSEYEVLNISDMVFGSRRGNANLSSVSITAGATTVSTTPINGIATFSGLSLEVPKNSTLVVYVKGTFTNSGTLVSSEEVRLGLDSVIVNGASSGTRVYEKSVTTTATAGDIAADTATDLTVGSTVGYSVGDVIQVHTAQGVSSFTGVVSSIGGAITLGVTGPQNLTECDGSGATTCYVTKWATREAVTSIAATAKVLVTDKTATDIDVSSTRGFATGDVVRIEADTADTKGGGFYTVTGITDGNTMTVIGVGEGTVSPHWGNSATTDRLTRMATTTSTQTSTTGDDLASSGSIATGTISVDSTVGLVVGDVVVLNSTKGTVQTKQLYTVSAVPSTTTVTLIGKSVQTDIVADSWMTELATTRTTTVSADSPIAGTTTASAVTLTSVAGFAVGDVVMITDDGTLGSDVYMVSAVSTTNSTITVIGETAFTASAGAYVTILASSTGNGKPYTVHDVEPNITLNASSPGASGTSSGSANQIVAVFDIIASGDRALTIKNLTLTRGGNAAGAIAAATQPKLYDYSSGSLDALLGTGDNWTGTSAGDTSLVTFDTPRTVTAGDMLTVAVTVNTSSLTTNNTFQTYIDTTGGLSGLFGGLSWYYTAASPSPGVEPTNASPTTLADTYPVYGHTLKY